MASVGTCIRSLIRMILWWENLGRSGARVPQRETRTKCEFPSKNFKIFFASLLSRHHNTPHKPIKSNSYTCHIYTYWKPRILHKKLKARILKSYRIRIYKPSHARCAESCGWGGFSTFIRLRSRVLFKSDLTDPPQNFDAHLLGNTNLSPSSFHFSVGFYIMIMFWVRWF